MECTRLCLAGVTISLVLLSSVVFNNGYSLAYELSPAASSSRRRDSGMQTVLDLFVDFAQDEEERHLHEEEHADQIYHQREKRFPRIPLGETCKTRRDCARSHCCAMKFGRPVCRQRPTLGKTCRPHAQSPGDASEMFTSCPCAPGLRCWKRKGKNIGVCV